jgi:hypothetical protein
VEGAYALRQRVPSGNQVYEALRPANPWMTLGGIIPLWGGAIISESGGGIIPLRGAASSRNRGAASPGISSLHTRPELPAFTAGRAVDVPSLWESKGDGGL